MIRVMRETHDPEISILKEYKVKRHKKKMVRKPDFEIF